MLFYFVYEILTALSDYRFCKNKHIIPNEQLLQPNVMVKKEINCRWNLINAKEKKSWIEQNANEGKDMNLFVINCIKKHEATSSCSSDFGFRFWTTDRPQRTRKELKAFLRYQQINKWIKHFGSAKFEKLIRSFYLLNGMWAHTCFWWSGNSIFFFFFISKKKLWISAIRWNIN